MSRHKKRMITYDSAQDRQSRLKEFKNAAPGAVLVASSMDRGINLPGNECRVIVVMKIPYLNLGDKQITTRLHSDKKGGQLWFSVNAVRTLVQMTGRAMRSVDDHCECVSPETRILTSELEWIAAENLKAGDRILSFDSQTSRLAPRKWRWGEIQATGVKELPRFEILLESGQQLIATPNHMWISKWGQAKDDKWLRTDQLRPGHCLNRYLNVWQTPDRRDIGWLSGLFDGEGCLVISCGKRNPHVTAIILAQKPGLVLNKAQRIAEQLGYATRLADHQKVYQLYINGGFAEHLRFLGQVRPERLLEKLLSTERNERFISRQYDRIKSVQRISPGAMVTLQSSTGTYIAEGYAAHNTHILDAQFARLYQQNKYLFPEWWRAALKMPK